MKRRLLLLPLLALTACFWGDDWDTEHLTGRYYVLGEEPGWGKQDWRSAQLYFKDERFGFAEPLIPRDVTAVAYNGAVLVAEVGTLVITQHSKRLECQYYLMPLYTGTDGSQARALVQGPFNRPTYLQKLRQLSRDEALTDSIRFVSLRISDFPTL